jgi:hypothetical protein
MAFMLADPDGQILDVSYGFEALTGFSWKEAVGSYGRFLHPRGMEAPAETLGFAMCSLHGISSDVEWVIMIKSGQLLRCKVRFDRLVGVTSSSTVILSTLRVSDASGGIGADQGGDHTTSPPAPLPPQRQRHAIKHVAHRCGIGSLNLTCGLATLLSPVATAYSMLQRHP